MIAAAALGLLCRCACAADLPVNSAPHDVTVYPQGARVVRAGEAQAGAGQVTAVFPDLPASLVESSLRLAVAGPRGTKFFGVQLRDTFTPDAVQARIKDLDARLEKLTDQLADVKDRMDARKVELDVLAALAKDNAARTAAQAASRPGALAELAGATGAVGARVRALLAENRKDERAARDLDRQVAALKAERDQMGTGQRQQKVAEAGLELAAAGTVRFELSYLVNDAGWTPVYDLKLDQGTGEPKVTIGFAGQVRQRSGEDWKDVKLSLSTSRPTEGAAIPDPTNWWIGFAQPVPSRKAVRYGAPAPAMARSAAAADSGLAFEALAAPEPVAMEQAETREGGYATTFAIGRPAVVPSDASLHRVGIAESSQPATVLLVAVPRLAPAAFVEATMTYRGEAPLLPGPANLFRGDDFAGTTDLKAVGPGESVPLSFGRDASMKVERKLLFDQKGAGFMPWSKSDRSYRWVTTLTSAHPGPVTVEVREQLPRSREKDIVVKPQELKPDPLPEDPDKPGLQRWRVDVPARGAAKVVFAYQVKFPEDRPVSGLE